MTLDVVGQPKECLFYVGSVSYNGRMATKWKNANGTYYRTEDFFGNVIWYKERT